MVPGDAVSYGAAVEQVKNGGRQRQIEMLGEYIVHDKVIKQAHLGRQSFCYLIRQRHKIIRHPPLFEDSVRR
jgi:hypothetical protein